jgi:hypothetical protein
VTKVAGIFFKKLPGMPLTTGGRRGTRYGIAVKVPEEGAGGS